MSDKADPRAKRATVWIRPTWGKGTKPESRSRFRGRYVYAWFSEDSPLPFYIGKGTGKRAWERHEDSDGRAMWCQTFRATAKGFRAEVIRDNLTDEGALLLESCLIAFTKLLGGLLCNQIDGISRQERPPLDLDSCAEARQGPAFAACGQNISDFSPDTSEKTTL